MRMWARASGHNRPEPALKPAPVVVRVQTQFFSSLILECERFMAATARGWCSGRSRTADPRPSRHGALFSPVNIEPTLRKQPTAVLLHEGVEVAERCDH